MRSDRLLIVDDEPEIGSFVVDVATPLGFDCRSTSDSAEFIHLLSEFRPTALIMDLQMPDIDGIELLQRLANVDSRACIILLSGMDSKVLGSAQLLGREYGLRMVGVLQKPVLIEDLEKLLQQCMALPHDEDLSADAVQQALDHGDFEIHYQPVVRLTTDSGQNIAAEALVRWRHPERGLLMPAAFLDVVRTAGLMRHLTDYVLRRAIEQLSSWIRNGLTGTVSVNIDPELIDDLELPDQLFRMLGGLDVPPAALILEVTERGALDRLAETMNILTRLRLKGIGLAIDDFGTGNSSLIQLHRMPFNMMKIDRSFIQPVASDDDCHVIVKALIDLAHNLGMTVCAEGVETRDALALLEGLKCDCAQGFLFSEALPAPELLEWYKAFTASGDSQSRRVSR